MTIWFSSDHHFSHKNIIAFKDLQGNPLRDFESIEEHDEYLVHCHNSVVQKSDRVFLVGDVCWNSSSMKYLERLNGQITLIMGNHDNQKFTSYQGKVHQLKGASYFNQDGINAIFTHIPIHPAQLEHRFQYNIHGHLHHHKLPDHRYLNVSMEQINYTPISFEEVKSRLKERETLLRV